MMKKRYELLIHTNYSIQDGIGSIEEYESKINEYGIKGYAITDRNGIFNYPNLIGRDNVIFGASLDVIDEELYNITLTKGKALLKDETFVVFDLETTGITFDSEIIEIGAVKVYQGKIVDSFFSRVKPRSAISEKSTEITGITNEDLVNERGIESVMPEFISFIGNSTLVAHNAYFDYGHIEAFLERNYRVIDTLQLARTLYAKKTKKFNLGSLCELFEIELDNAHNALCDCKATAMLLIKMLDELAKRNIFLYEEINNIVNRNEMWKKMHPYPITVLVKNDIGYRNLLEILNDGFNKHFYGDARILKSILRHHHEGLLFGSGSVGSELFQYAYEKNERYLLSKLEFFDYIEINHSDSYRHYQEFFGDNYLEIIHKANKRLEELGNRLGKKVVAVSNCYYANSDDYQKYYDNVKNPLAKRFNPLFKYERLPYAHLKSINEWVQDLSYLANPLKAIFENTEAIYKSISFSGPKLHKEAIDLSLVDKALEKTKRNFIVIDNKFFSDKGKAYFIRCLKDFYQGNRVFMPGIYEFENNLHVKTNSIKDLYCIMPKLEYPLMINLLQYEILENKENNKITHLPYQFYQDYVFSIKIIEDPYVTLLERLRQVAKSNNNGLLDDYILRLDIHPELKEELAWYKCCRPMLFYKYYLDVLGSGMEEELAKDGFILVNPNLEISLPNEHVIDGNKIIRPLSYYVGELASELYESNRLWPIEGLEDLKLRFREERVNKYLEGIMLLIGNRI